MRTRFTRFGLLLLLASACGLPTAQAQFLKKLKEKVEQKISNKIDQKVDSTLDKTLGTGAGANNSDYNNTQGNTGMPSVNQGSSKNRPVNKTGAGLSNTAVPDVAGNLENAGKSMQANNPAQTRQALQQAILGVEIQLGKQVLQSLPPTVTDLSKDTLQNVVMSNQFGWSNMTIRSVYVDGKEKQMTLSIGNMPAYANIINWYNLYAGNAIYGGQQENRNIKQTNVKGQKALIQFEESKGYTLMAELGQSSLMIWECINFANEEEVMNAANSFDIESIRKLMGEGSSSSFTENGAKAFDQYLAAAKTAYAANQLEETHFSLQQAISEVDMITGRQILQLLPAQLNALMANTSRDHVSANTGFAGATVHRAWAKDSSTAEIDIISNSPMISTLNAFLNMPYGGLMRNSDTRVEKIQGYKCRLDKNGDGNIAGKSNYTVEIPLSNTLLTFRISNTTDTEALTLANSLPIARIVQLTQ